MYETSIDTCNIIHGISIALDHVSLISRIKKLVPFTLFVTLIGFFVINLVIRILVTFCIERVRDLVQLIVV